MKPKTQEGFGPFSLTFVPEGYPRFGLRGDLLRRSAIDKLFIRPDRRIRLNESGGEMYESNLTPPEEGMKGCKKVACPTAYGQYDNLDQCWQCGDAYQHRSKLRDLWPH